MNNNQINNQAILSGFVVNAEKIAEEAFQGMTDKAGQPYINHIKRVAASVETDEEKIVAFLHDILEDCEGWTICRISNIFNWKIAEAVDLLTRKENDSYEKFIVKVTSNYTAMKVKLADLEDNMNLNRITEVKESDLIRTAKYKNAHEYIKSKINE